MSNYFFFFIVFPKVSSFVTALFAKIVNIRKFDYTHKVLVLLVYNLLL
jgi:hypothetical protein